MENKNGRSPARLRPFLADRTDCRFGATCEPIGERFKIYWSFKNGEMQGSEKIQAARCILTDKRSGFFR
jgi:hypothetical protein